LDSQIVETDKQISDLGDIVFMNKTIQKTSTKPIWWDIKIPVDQIILVENIGKTFIRNDIPPNIPAVTSWIDYNYMENLSIDGDSFFNILYSGEYLGSLENWNLKKDSLLNFGNIIRTGSVQMPQRYDFNCGEFRVTYTAYMRDGIDYVDRNVDKLFPSVVGDPPAGDDQSIGGSVYPQAQEAILQNIRFIKDLINSVDENLWASFNNTNSLILSNLIGIRDDITSKKQTGSIVNVVNSQIDNSQIVVEWKKIGGLGLSELKAVDDFDPNNGDIKLITLGDNFNDIGKYIITINPKREIVSIDGSVGDVVYTSFGLGDGKSENYYYGYNAQLYSQDNKLVGDPKIVVSSTFDSSKQYIKLSPLVDRTTDYKDYKLELWSNKFIPILIEVDIVEHNATTLSYSMYGQKEFNTKTGICTLWDYAGNIYKELSFGKHSNLSTNGDIIEYRTPLGGTGRY
jgi:hypothetical protein